MIPIRVLDSITELQPADAGCIALSPCSVSHTSACIGQAASTLACGVVSHASEAARALGLQTGLALAPQTEALARSPACTPPNDADSY